MSNVELAQASCDPSVTAIAFLPLLREALKGADAWTREFAADVFVRKVAERDPESWNELQPDFSNRSPNDSEGEYVFQLARLGHLFVDGANPNRSIESAAVVLWLIRRDPSDAFLKNPYCLDIEGELHDSVRQEWRQAIAKNKSDVRILSNAAEFLFLKHAVEAEALLNQCAAIESNNPIWNERLTELRELHTH